LAESTIEGRTTWTQDSANSGLGQLDHPQNTASRLPKVAGCDQPAEYQDAGTAPDVQHPRKLRQSE